MSRTELGYNESVRKEGLVLIPPGTLRPESEVFNTQMHTRGSSMGDSTILKDDYAIILEEGALVPGGALDLWSLEAFGLYSQYAAIGFIYGMIPGLAYPVFQIYLGLQGYQVKSYALLVNIAWSFKIIFGMLSDCFPIFGYRRKPYMFIGWAICCTCCLMMAIVPFGDPYCNAPDTDPVGVKACREQNFKLVPQYLNKNIESVFYTFTIPSMLASTGYVMAACASDAMVVQYAQREPLATRGRIQTAIYTVRSATGILSQLIIGLFLNGPHYGGSFSFSISVNVIYAMMCVPAILVCFTTLFWLKEYKTERAPFSKWIHGMWTLLQKQALWQILAFRFISNLFQTFGSTAIYPVSQVWVKLEPLVDSMTSALGSVLFTFVLGAVGKYGLNWNWRWTIAISTVMLVTIDASVYMITIWDIYRNQWFYTGVALADQLPNGVRFIVSVFCAVELADLGNEGAVYGLVTTINNLAAPVSGVFYKYVDSYFDVRQETLKSDTTEVRWDVTYTFIISYSMKLSSLVWLFLLPPQKAHLQRLKKHGRVSKLAGALCVILFVVFLSFSVTTNLLSIYPSTKCLRIAGGSGCSS